MSATRVIEIRSYKLKPGSGSRFHELMMQQSLPLLKAAQTDVVRFGASLNGEDAYYLIRAYDSVEDLRASQDAFYGSEAWREGPREEILALIETYTDAVIPLPPDVIDGLRAQA
jgi:NIPSNAP